MPFKNLESSDILLSSFEVHKTFTVTNEDTGSGVYAFQINKGADSTKYGWNTTDAAQTTLSGSTFYSIPNYYVINNMFYRDLKQLYDINPGSNTVNVDNSVDYIAAVPTSSEAVITYTETRHLYDIVDKPSKLILRRPHTRQLRDTANVISIPQELYGEYVKIESVRLTDDSTDSTIILQDDGRGNLYDVAYSASYSRRHPDSNNSGSVVGNVFYEHGLLVITDTGSYSNVGIETGSNGFSLQFDSTQTIYEREYICNVGENEFQFTNNRSLKLGQSGSVAFSGSAYNDEIYKNSIYDAYPYDLTGFATGSFRNRQYEIGTELIGEATHSHFATYVSTIGLYNEANELVAIGKTAKPIKNEKEMILSFVVRFDTN
tara:strand:+ start:5788 stop:6912 length:1125 start_codon:yes stop_codon:yes gene_type:complete